MKYEVDVQCSLIYTVNVEALDFGEADRIARDAVMAAMETVFRTECEITGSDVRSVGTKFPDSDYGNQQELLI